jgi:transposase
MMRRASGDGKNVQLGAATIVYSWAVLWMARSGARWRDLPERFGRYGTVKQRYYEWVNRGFFQTIFNALNQD